MSEVTYIDHMGTDLSVVNAARVSFKKESMMNEHHYFDETGERYIDYTLKPEDEKLINYLAKHEHTSPFNHTYLTCHVKAPIFVARQLVKHKFMPWNEVSRRYVDDQPEFFEPEWRSRPEESIKQGSGSELSLHWATEQMYTEAVQAAVRAYDALLQANVAPEQARAVLPQNMYTEWYWSGTLGAWSDMYKLRIDAHAQKETQMVAAQVGDIIAPLFPVSWKALVSA